ncbi:MAG TPA: hypothetical protein PLP83_10260 [Candidatus Aminicenantes bacterium]|nr:hypothetical protein [Candidatus Aminicenantes bacterium]
MDKRLATAFLAAGLLLACAGPEPPAGRSAAASGGPSPGAPQFTPGELESRERWEDFLRTAEVVASAQIVGAEAVTSPWVLTLKKGETVHRGLWKNARGRMGGYWEGWTYEIAAYRLDKHLGLGLVPPTVERRFRDERGSCQYWVDGCISLKERLERNIKMPPAKAFSWNRATYLQRLFDNLIANEDRHANQILITPDWRMVLIDHSRSFRTAARFTGSLLYSAKNPEGPRLMSELPRAVVDRVRALDAATVRAVVGEYLTDEEIGAVLVRRDLVLREIARLVKVNGEAKVLY